jgi:prephenate dehydrogenase
MTKVEEKFMTVNVTIIGLGQIGASIGLALASQSDQVKRIGHDIDINLSKHAEKMGAVDKSIINLPASVRDADLVLLALPTDQIRETMAIIGPELKDSAVVMDTAPVKEVVAAWAKELLPPGRFYVGLTPVINPAYLQEREIGQEAAHADLFKDGLMVIVVPPSTPSEAVKLADDLTRLLGCSPLFADPLEVDSLMAAMHTIPQLLAAAVLNITVDQPGWREGRKLAGRAYAELTGSIMLQGGPEAVASSAVLSHEHTVRAIDNLIAALQVFRGDIKEQDAKALTERLELARAGRESWWSERQSARWGAEEQVTPVDMPRPSDMFGKMFGLGRKPKPKD